MVENLIDENNLAFVRAIAAGDASAVAAVYTDDARLLAPDAEMAQGREQVLDFWRAAISAGIAGASLTTLSVDVRDDLAIEVGRYRLRLEPAGAEPGTDKGKYVVVHRRTATGDWKWAVDIFNSDGRR
jgi:uncharacterized protein (TIGR02246 family)